MKVVFLVLIVFCLGGCAQSGYSPSYIISDGGEAHLEHSE